MKQITLNGTCVLQIMKDENGKFSHAQILQATEKGLSPVCDFSVTLLQENQQIGIEFTFDSANIYSEFIEPNEVNKELFKQTDHNEIESDKNQNSAVFIDDSEYKYGIFNSYFINQAGTLLSKINELSAFLIKNEKPTNDKQLLDYKEKLITLLSYDYNWLCAEYENTSKLIKENNAGIAADTAQKNDDLYSKSYDLYFFNKYYILAPHSLFKVASNYQFIFGEDFCYCIDEYKSKNKEILNLTKPKFSEII